MTCQIELIQEDTQREALEYLLQSLASQGAAHKIWYTKLHIYSQHILELTCCCVTNLGIVRKAQFV